MCLSTPKPPTPPRIAAPPKMAPAPFQIETSQRQSERASGERTPQDVRRFDLSLPASFTIPF